MTGKLLLATKPVTPQFLLLDIPSGASVQLYKKAQLKFSYGDFEAFGSGCALQTYTVLPGTWVLEVEEKEVSLPPHHTAASYEELQVQV